MRSIKDFLRCYYYYTRLTLKWSFLLKRVKLLNGILEAIVDKYEFLDLFSNFLKMTFTL